MFLPQGESRNFHGCDPRVNPTKYLTSSRLRIPPVGPTHSLHGAIFTLRSHSDSHSRIAKLCSDLCLRMYSRRELPVRYGIRPPFISICMGTCSFLHDVISPQISRAIIFSQVRNVWHVSLLLPNKFTRVGLLGVTATAN